MSLLSGMIKIFLGSSFAFPTLVLELDFLLSAWFVVVGNDIYRPQSGYWDFSLLLAWPLFLGLFCGQSQEVFFLFFSHKVYHGFILILPSSSNSRPLGFYLTSSISHLSPYPTLKILILSNTNIIEFIICFIPLAPT